LFSKKQPQSLKIGEDREFYLNDTDRVIFNSRGLIPVIIQHTTTNEVLHLGYLDRWALEISLDKKVVYLYRRSTGHLVKLGKNSDYQINSIYLDKNKRHLLFKVIPSTDERDTSNFSHMIYYRNM
jgi:phosphoribosyl-ATP pyrophosphohydrolase/phosphoribosyl-AMP cyclohydrolase